MGFRYLLDTNILSEPVKPKADIHVIQRLEKHAGMYVTASTVWHELLYGAERMPNSKRKDHLSSYLDSLEVSGLNVLAYDKEAAAWLAGQRVLLSQRGIATSMTDGEIAAVAYTNNLVLVTRNVKDFSMFEGLRIENWFEA